MSSIGPETTAGETNFFDNVIYAAWNFSKTCLLTHFIIILIYLDIFIQIFNVILLLFQSYFSF